MNLTLRYRSQIVREFFKISCEGPITVAVFIEVRSLAIKIWVFVHLPRKIR